MTQLTKFKVGNDARAGSYNILDTGIDCRGVARLPKGYAVMYAGKVCLLDSNLVPMSTVDFGNLYTQREEAVGDHIIKIGRDDQNMVALVYTGTVEYDPYRDFSKRHPIKYVTCLIIIDFDADTIKSELISEKCAVGGTIRLSWDGENINLTWPDFVDMFGHGNDYKPRHYRYTYDLDCRCTSSLHFVPHFSHLRDTLYLKDGRKLSVINGKVYNVGRLYNEELFDKSMNDGVEVQSISIDETEQFLVVNSLRSAMVYDFKTGTFPVLFNKTRYDYPIIKGESIYIFHVCIV